MQFIVIGVELCRNIWQYKFMVAILQVVFVSIQNYAGMLETMDFLIDL